MLRHKGRGDERGVSVVLGAALVMGIIIAFVSAFLSAWIPGEVGRREHTQMRGVEESFRELRAVIEGLQAGEFRSVDVNMGADYSIPLVPTPRGVGTLSVTPAPIHEIRIPPSDDAYVVENLPTTNFGSENSLRVASRLDNNKRSYLKFSLENIPLGVMILEADLWLYCYESTLENVTDVRCRQVENDNWTELTITWNKAIENYPIGAVLDNLYVGGTGWFHWSAKDFVALEVTGDRLLSLVLRARNENYDNIERYANFFSKEAVDKRPYLHVRYTTGPPIWIQTDWAGGETSPVLESGKWYEDYDNYYRGENENSKKQGEVRLENSIPLETSWFQTTKVDFENGTSRENLDTSTFPGSVVLAGDNIVFGNTTNTAEYQPYTDYTYIQRLDPGGQYAAPYNGVIIQWRWYPRATAQGAKFKIFRHVTGTVWTMVGESGPKNLSSGMNTFSDIYLPVKAGDRIGGYTGSSGRTYWSTTSGYYACRTEGDIQGTSSFTDHLDPRRLPIDATLKRYRYSGTLISRVQDTIGFETNWRKISWGENLPPDTDITLQTRTGDSPTPDENWSGWSPPYKNPAGELITSPRARYIQYKVNFSTKDTAQSPVLDWVKIEYITSALYKPSGQLESSVYDAGSPVDWRTIAWEAETPVIVGENKPVDAEPDPLIDWSPLIGENLSSLENAQAQDDIYETIAEELRSPWWNRSWACRRPLTINNENNPNMLENYQVKIKVKYDENMLLNFDDLRFVDNDNVTELSYWIENYNLGDNAIVWVRVLNIPANGSKTIYMYYGNPGAPPGSDFSATFPNALIIDGTSRTLGGVQRYDWVEVKNGGTLTVQSENMLQLFARKIIVDSTSRIDATGSGYPGGPTNRRWGRQENGYSYDGRPGTGGGTGGYALSNSDGPGGGGGGYAGSGGNGGGARGENDYPGIGGLTFGNATDNSIYMGSGGGAGGLSNRPLSVPENDPWNAGGAGGAGGGVIRLNAGVIEISGTISADGGDGAGGMGNVSGAGSGGGGGGSGGTILIEGNEVTIIGTLTAKGGAGGARSPGSTGSGPYGGAGGGGGGGRIKVFYDNRLDNAGATYSVKGGDNGGPSYEAPVAQSGTSGTTYTEVISYPEPVTSVGSEELESADRGQRGYYLNWEHRVTGVRLGYENYTFYIRGYSDNDEKNIGVYIWMSKTNSWYFIDNLPKAPGDPITFNIRPMDLNDYIVGGNLSIGYFNKAGDATRTLIHIDYCILEVTGYFTTEVRVYTRTGNTENAYDGSWSGWEEATNGGEVPSPGARCIQYRVDLSTQRGQISPVFKEITITHRKDTEYGTVGFSSGHVYYPDQAYVSEGGSVILTQGGVNLTVLEPVMIKWENAENNRLNVYANFWIIENERATLTSTGTRTIRVFCVDSRATVIPVEGPNREQIILKAISPYGDVWGRYLASENERLNAMGYNASFDPNTLTLTIGGRDNTPGVKDIYYYEHLKELVVELV